MRFERLLLAAILGLALVIVALSMASARLGPTVDSLTTSHSLDGTSVNTQIGVIFTEPMDIRSTERAFRVSPHVSGDFTWSGNELLYIPRKSLRYHKTYIVTINQKAADKAGRGLLRVFHSSFTTQARHLLYLGTSGAERNRIMLISLNGSRQVVGSNDGLITSYGISSDRSLVVYTKRGASNERPDELWLLSLADNSAQQLFRRSDWNISQPRLSPDGRYVAFLASNVMVCRKYYGCYRDQNGALVYLYDLRTRHLTSFAAHNDVPITDSIAFSPAGQVSYTDLGSALVLASPKRGPIIHIPHRGNSLEFAGFDVAGDKAAFVGQTATSVGGGILVYERGNYRDISRGVYDAASPSFSTSGKQLTYSAYRREQGVEPVYGINRYSFKSGRTKHLTKEKRWSDWDSQWSLDDAYVAFIRSEPQEAMYMGSGAIWVVKSNGSGVRSLHAEGKDTIWVS